MRRIADLLVSVRMRTTLAATSVVALALLIGALFLVHEQRTLGVDEVDRTITTRAGDLALLLSRGGDVDTLDVARQEEALVQVVDGEGRVVAASENIVGLPPVAAPAAIGIDTVDDLPIDPGEQFRLLTNKVLVDDDLVSIIVAGSLDPVDENIEILVRNLALGLPALLALVALSAWLLVGLAMRPVEAIRREVEAISDHGLDRRVPEPRAQDEIGRLARTMNRMLARLQTAWDRQEQFVADASHELRSPLTAMRSHLEVDQHHPDTADPAATRAELLDDIEQLQRLIDDLLYLARGETGGRERRSVDVDDLVLAEAERQRATTSVVIDTSGVSGGQIQGNPGDLRRLVRNLLDNAVQHARSEIRVLLREDEEVLLTVADDGPGIPPEVAQAIFQRFVRLDEARTRTGGSGLGLAIAREIVERHGGSITVDEAPGGARFLVRLPRAGQPPASTA